MAATEAEVWLVGPEDAPGLQPRTTPVSLTLDRKEFERVAQACGVPVALGESATSVVVVLAPQAHLASPAAGDATILGGGGAVELAVRLFSSCISNRGVFMSENDRLLESVYLPTQLAQDGEGALFDERIVSRLIGIGLVPIGAEVLAVRDRGGWESIRSLDARIDVTHSFGGQRRHISLVGSAIVPTPPQSIGAMEVEFRRRVAEFERFAIPHSVLAVQRGVLYQRRGDAISALAPKDIAALGRLAFRIDALAAGPGFVDFAGATDIGLAGDSISEPRADLELFSKVGDQLIWKDIRNRVDILVGRRRLIPGEAYERLRAVVPVSARDEFAESYHRERRE